MKEICAWCQKILKEGPEKPISHGICPECKDKFFPGVKSGGSK